MTTADITAETLGVIGYPESETLEYKAVLPPASTVAQLICSLANTAGGFIILGVSDDDGQIKIHGLSDEFRAVSITDRAVGLLSPQPVVAYQYVDYKDVRTFAIKVEKSAAPISLGGREFIRKGIRSVPQDAAAAKVIRNPKIELLVLTVDQSRINCTSAKSQFLNHFGSVLKILDDLENLLYPVSALVPTQNPEGKILMRILFSSCADNFETYLSDLLFEIYLAKPETLRSEATVSVREVLECVDLQEFIIAYARKKLSKLQRGSVRGFISDNKQITALSVLDSSTQDEIEKTLQIRHLYSHRNGIIDLKFQGYFPSSTLNAEYGMSLNEFLGRFKFLAEATNMIDRAALQAYSLATYS